MTHEEVSILFTRWRDAYACHDCIAVAANYTEDCFLESPTYGRLRGRGAIEGAYRSWFATFPDTEAAFGDLLITKDRVVQTATIHGTDTGGFLGQAPTGRRFRLFLVQLFDLDNSRIAHERRVFDVNGFLLELATGPDALGDAAPMYRAALVRARQEQELKIAAEIQRALMPPLEHQGTGFDLAAMSSPCRAIGGDFLDYFDRPGAFGFVLGDVSGKGPPAALLAAKLQGILAAHSSSAPTPAEMLGRVNQELARRTVESRFATMVYGELCDGHLTYSSAGHNPPLIVGKRGVRRLETGGLILGIFKDAIFEQETLHLDPGDIVAVFSDGITEALNVDGAEFGEQRLLSSICENRESVPKTILKQILGSVHEFCDGAEQSDDLTALILRYTGA